MEHNENFELLDVKGKPIPLERHVPTAIDKEGLVTQAGKPVGRIAVLDVLDPHQLTKSGGSMLAYPDMARVRPAANTLLRSESQERANVHASTELTSLMETQRQLEANANMIRYQDQMLAKLVNEVGKIG